MVKVEVRVVREGGGGKGEYRYGGGGVGMCRGGV